jgi:glycosyltransferase involved in cell wall biosynthesis
LAGHLNKQDCSNLIAQSRAVLLPSQWEETFGLVIVEAMAAGVAPIASSHGSFPELITDGVNGVLYKAGDSDDLARVIMDVETNGARFAAYGVQARITYEQQHDPRRNIDQLLDIYRFAMAKPVVASP